MKCITLWQPWASLIALGHKRIETRSWGTSYRGRLGIHAAMWRPKHVDDILAVKVAYSNAKELELTLPDFDLLPRGQVVAIAELVDVRVSEGLREWPIQETYFGNLHRGRYAWVLEHVQALDSPIAVRGGQGLWEFKGDGIRGY